MQCNSKIPMVIWTKAVLSKVFEIFFRKNNNKESAGNDEDNTKTSFISCQPDKPSFIHTFRLRQSENWEERYTDVKNLENKNS